MVELGNLATPKRADGTRTRRGGELDRYRGRIRTCAIEQMDGRAPIGGAVELSAEFVISRPPSHYTAAMRLTKAARSRVPPLDLSKLVRAIEDAMTGVVYDDDVQITCYGRVTKRYASSGGIGGVKIAVRELPCST